MISIDVRGCDRHVVSYRSVDRYPHHLERGFVVDPNPTILLILIPIHDAHTRRMYWEWTVGRRVSYRSHARIPTHARPPCPRDAGPSVVGVYHIIIFLQKQKITKRIFLLSSSSWGADGRLKMAALFLEESHLGYWNDHLLRCGQVELPREERRLLRNDRFISSELVVMSIFIFLSLILLFL